MNKGKKALKIILAFLGVFLVITFFSSIPNRSVYESIMITCLYMVELLQVTMTDWIHTETFFR